MMQLNLLKATQLVEKTMPCVLSKMKVWFMVCFGFLASTLAGAGVGLIIFAFGIESSVLASILAGAGFLGCGYLLVKLRGSIFVPVRAGHVRVMLAQMQSSETIAAKVQLKKYKGTVKDYFESVEKLAPLERKIRGVLKEVYAQKLNLDRLSFGSQYAKQLLDVVTGIFVAFITEVILAYAIRNKVEGGRPASSKKALALYVQEMDGFSKSVWISNVFMYLGWIFFIFVMIFPINWLTGMLPFSVGIWNLVFAMVFAWMVKAVIFESIAVAAFIPLFFDRVKDQEVKAETTERLSALSVEFTEIQ